MRRPALISLFVVFLALVLFWPVEAARASDLLQTPNDLIKLDIRAGFDGYVEQGTWTPITVTASNSGDDLSGALRVKPDTFGGAQVAYTRPIELPRGSRKQVTFYVADLSSYGGDMLVDLVVRDRVVASELTRVQFVDQRTLLIGIWSDSPRGLEGLAQVKPSSGNTAVAMLTAQDLPPDGVGWSALDVLVVSDADSGQLSDGQRHALQEWLAGGGRLIIVGGMSFQRTLAGLGEVTPVMAQDTQRVSLLSLSIAAGMPFVRGRDERAPVAVGDLRNDAQVLLSDGNIPLVAWRKVGYGRVDFLAADLGLEPMVSWKEVGRLWRLILKEGQLRPGWAYGFNRHWESARSALAEVPGVSLPSAIQLCGFLTLYVILIGPVNYFVLWRMKRREMAWFTIPALVLLFSGIAYFTGFQLRGSQAILHRLAVVHSWYGTDIAKVDALTGIWSPRRLRYDLEVGEGYLARPMSHDLGSALAGVDDIEVEQIQGTILRGVRVDVGAIQPFVIEGYTEAPRIESTLAFKMQDRQLRLVGNIVNYSEIDLEKVALVLPSVTYRLPNVRAGQVLPIDTVVNLHDYSVSLGHALDPFPADATPYGWYPHIYSELESVLTSVEYCFGEADQRPCNLVSSILNGEWHQSGVYLVGWGNQTPLDFDVLNASAERLDLALYIIEVDHTAFFVQ